MREGILELREEGKSYRQIAKELDCSKSTVAYHLTDGEKQKAKQRSEDKNKTTKYKVYKKIDGYMSGYGEHVPRNEAHHKLYEKITKNPICYITGQQIDLSDISTWSIDHINPRSRGGKNTIENAGLCLKEVNQAKADLQLDEFVELCKDIIAYQTQGGSLHLE